MNEIEIMRKTKSFAIIGASAREDSYGFKLVMNLTKVGYKVFPINPKYGEIYGLKTYKSLSEIKEPVENIVFSMSPENNINILSQSELPDAYVWFPPECWTDDLINLATNKNLNFQKDKCPIGTYLKINLKKDSDDRI